MNVSFAGKTIAFMVAAGFHQTEFTELQRALVKAGARLLTIAPDQGVVNGWQNSDNSWGHTYPVDQLLNETLAADLDMLVIPGGERSLAKLSQNLHAKRILSHATDGLMPVVLFGEAQSMIDGDHVNVMKIVDLSGESWLDDVLAHLTTDFDAEELRAAA